MSNVLPIMEIPPEILGMILNKLPDKDALHLRLVNKKFKESVDTLFNFTVKINQKTRKSDLPFMLNLRIGNLTIANSLKIFQFTVPRTRSNLLQNPNLLKSLKVEIQKSDLALENCKDLHNLIADSAKDLKKLDLCIKPDQMSIFDNSEDWDFKNLLNLGIEVRTITTADADTLCTFINRVKCQKIRGIHFVAEPLWKKRGEDIGRISDSILTFVVKHGKTLEEVEINFKGGDPGYESRLSEECLNDLWKVNSIKKLDIIDTPLSAKDLWLNFCKSQVGLKYFKIGNDFGKDLPPSFYVEIFSTNSRTLVSVLIHQISSLDLTVFADCPNLEDITIFGDPLCASRLPENVPVLFHVDRLPSKLKTFMVMNCTILSSDLVAWLSSEKAKRMLMLNLTSVGSAGLMGISGEVLEKLLNLKTPFFFIIDVNDSNKESWDKARDRLVGLGWDEKAFPQIASVEFIGNKWLEIWEGWQNTQERVVSTSGVLDNSSMVRPLVVLRMVLQGYSS